MKITETVKTETKKLLEIETSMICDDCNHWVSMHADNGQCYSCPRNKCELLKRAEKFFEEEK